MSPELVEAWWRGDTRPFREKVRYRPWWPMIVEELSLSAREHHGHLLASERDDLERAVALRDALIAVAGPPGTPKRRR